MKTDCAYCHNSPCTCGWRWTEYDVEYLQKMKETIEGVIEFKQSYPKFFQNKADSFFNYMTVRKIVNKDEKKDNR